MKTTKTKKPFVFKDPQQYTIRQLRYHETKCADWNDLADKLTELLDDSRAKKTWITGICAEERKLMLKAEELFNELSQFHFKQVNIIYRRLN